MKYRSLLYGLFLFFAAILSFVPLSYAETPPAILEEECVCEGAEYDICAGDEIELSCATYAACEPYCTKWLPEQYLTEDSHSGDLVIRVAPEVTTVYTFYVSDENGEIVDEVVFTVNVQESDADMTYFEGFIAVPIEIVNMDGLQAPPTSVLKNMDCYEGYSELQFLLEGELFNLNETLPEQCEEFIAVDIFLTDNEGFDTGSINTVETNYENSYHAYWYHIFDGGECGQDYLFFKSKNDQQELLAQCEQEDLIVQGWDFEFESPPFTNPLPAFSYSFTQRCFGPWVDFGHFEFIPCVSGVIRPNSFVGDNREFSLEGSKRYSGANPSNSSSYQCPELSTGEEVTSRIHHNVSFTLGSEGLNCQDVYSSGTCGASNFNLIPPSMADCEYNCEVESSVYGNAWFAINTLFLHAQGSDGCVSVSTDIDLRTKISFAIEEVGGQVFLRCRGVLFHKEFPAHEYFISDNYGNKLFIHTFSPASEAELICELFINLYDGVYPFDYRIEIDPITGRFLNGMVYSTLRDEVLFESVQIIVPGGLLVDEGANACVAAVRADREISFDYSRTSISDWNNGFFSTSPAGDCDSPPCIGLLGTCEVTEPCGQ